MTETNDILEELKAISPFLAGIEKLNVFEIPANYFNGLAEKISFYAFLNQGKDAISSEVQSVPTGYFDSLSDQILAKIKSEYEGIQDTEMGELSPLLASLKDKNVFTAPEGYFENISQNIFAKLNPQPARIVSIKKLKTFWKYAAAAVLTGAITVSSLNIFNSSPDMVKNNSVVTESSGIPDYVQSSLQYKTPEQINNGIATLSDDDIINYLEKHGNIMDNDQLTNDIDTKDLPAPADYLTDDNALNNYLSTIGDKSTDSKAR